MSLGGGKPRPGQLGAGKRPRAGKLKKTGERVGIRLETQVQKKMSSLGARKQSGSGNYIGAKGDIDFKEPESLLFELKEITGRRMSAVEVTAWLRKIAGEARGVRKTPGLVIKFPNLEGAVPKVWAMLPLDVMRDLVEAAGWEALEKE